LSVVIIPVSVIIPTANRAAVLAATLASIANQNLLPQEIIIVDASVSNDTANICKTSTVLNIKYVIATQKGAAVQRNQGIDEATTDYIFFMDDDIDLAPGCIEKIWQCVQSDATVGAVNAMITNQKYHTPGTVTKWMYRLMHGKKLNTYAGKCIGPAWNLLPQDDDSLPEYQAMEWLNTTCTLYRKQALPQPAFSSHFTGYSLMEDVTLSLIVGRQWKLYNARTASIFHNSQPGEHKNNIVQTACMQLVNRYYVMTAVMHKKKIIDHVKLFLFELFNVITSLANNKGRKEFVAAVWGRCKAVVVIASKKHS
jgi:glycosyltransferase involved in cell wall biosynthesis